MAVNNTIFDSRSRIMKIDKISLEQTQKIFEKTKREWKKLGEEEPYFSVITHDEMKLKNITDETLSEFFRSGQGNAIELLNLLKRNGIEDSKDLDILELGCGCGRITKSLSEYFNHVVALDISEGNLKIAKENVISENVDFFLIKEVEDYLKLPQADVIYSILVLQHNCPPVIEYILKAMMDKLKPNGIFIFQVPTYRKDYSFIYEEYIKQADALEMHCFPQNRIFELIDANQCIPLQVFPYECTGADDHSTMFIIRKKN